MQQIDLRVSINKRNESIAQMKKISKYVGLDALISSDVEEHLKLKGFFLIKHFLITLNFWQSPVECPKSNVSSCPALKCFLSFFKSSRQQFLNFSS